MTSLSIILLSIIFFFFGFMVALVLSSPSPSRQEGVSHVQRYPHQKPVEANISINLNLDKKEKSSNDYDQIIDVDYEPVDDCYKIVSYKDSGGRYRSRAVRAYIDRSNYD